MRLVQYVNCISPHQVPLARELVARLGVENFRYVYLESELSDRKRMGWSEHLDEWMISASADTQDFVDACDVLLTGIRDVDLFQRRERAGLKTFYMGERWFKPIGGWLVVGGWRLEISLPGWVRMLVPSYRRMAKRFVKWIENDPNGRVLAIGPWARKDMLRLGVPESKILPWGYFVAPSTNQTSNIKRQTSNVLHILWVGRMLDWKRVDTIIRALHEVKGKGEGERWSVQLTLVGDGPEKPRLQRLAACILKKASSSIVRLRPSPSPVSIAFLPSQPIAKIREIMCAHDVYVLSSDEGEGWGAAVSEALEEGMHVVGTYEAGASGAILSACDLFHAGDYKTLAKILVDCARQKSAGTLRGQKIGEWCATSAAKQLLEWCEGDTND